MGGQHHISKHKGAVLNRVGVVLNLGDEHQDDDLRTIVRVRVRAHNPGIEPAQGPDDFAVAHCDYYGVLPVVAGRGVSSRFKYSDQFVSFDTPVAVFAYAAS